MNELIQNFFTIILILGFIVGVIYTVKNNSSLNKLLVNEKLLYEFNNLEIIDRETLKMAYWLGNLKIYENYILIEKLFISKSYYHFIISSKHPNSKKKQANTINISECLFINNNEIQLKGIKHRVMSDSMITIKIKTENKVSLKKIYELINTCFLIETKAYN